jgi:Carbon monoxide dehydrogenase subunit G (CoxG)
MEYTAKSDVGGRLAQLGGRLIDATANEFAGDFFEKFAAIVGKPQAMGAEVGAPQKAGCSIREDAGKATFFHS